MILRQNIRWLPSKRIFYRENQKGEYGLLDREGEKAVGFDYSEMEFPKDTMQYQYIKVKQNKNWGIVDYDENPLVPLNFEKVSEYSNGNTIAADITEIQHISMI